MWGGGMRIVCPLATTYVRVASGTIVRDTAGARGPAPESPWCRPRNSGGGRGHMVREGGRGLIEVAPTHICHVIPYLLVRQPTARGFLSMPLSECV